MARKSQRLSAGAATTLPSHKRAASNLSLSTGEIKKSKTQKATPTKSQYFTKRADGSTRSKNTAEDSGDELAPNDDDEEELASAPEDDLSEFGSAHDSDDAEDDDDDNDDEYESEVEETKSRRKSSSNKAAAGKSKTVSGGELWREGVKTGLGPGQQVVIKKPKARPAGKVPYSDGSIHPNTLLFLKDLKMNNNREWLKSESILLPLSFLPTRSFCSWACTYDALSSSPRAVLSLQQKLGLGRSGYLSDPVIHTRCCSFFIMLHTSAASLTLQQADAERSARSRFQAGREGLVLVRGISNRATRRDRRHCPRAARQRHCELQPSLCPPRYRKAQILRWALRINYSLTLNRTDLPHLSRCPVLQRSNSVQGEPPSPLVYVVAS